MSERKHGRDTEGIHPRFARRVWLFNENRADWSSDSVAYALIAENSNAKIYSMLSVYLQRSIRLRRQYRVRARGNHCAAGSCCRNRQHER